MGRAGLPLFPKFELDEFFWVTSAILSAWQGYQVRNGPYGTKSEEGRSDGAVQILFAPEGRDESPLSEHEVELVRWVIDNQGDVHNAMLAKLFEAYPKIRKEAMEWLDEDKVRKTLPEVRHPEQLRSLVGISSINVHQIERDGKPFIGVELGCTWDEEHGAGVLLHGSTALEVGGADTAILLWIAKEYLTNKTR